MEGCLRYTDVSASGPNSVSAVSAHDKSVARERRLFVLILYARNLCTSDRRRDRSVHSPLPSYSPILTFSISPGASGFIAAHVVQAYLAAGFTVIGTVRSASRGDYLVRVFDSPKFSYEVVPDIEGPGALDALATRADAFVHTASPVSAPKEQDFDPQYMLGPAVNGTLNVLRGAASPGCVVPNSELVRCLC